MTYQDYEQEVQRHLTDRRFYHSQCVAREAARLAQRYGADMEKARLCGILHDIMKDTPPEEQLKILEDSGIILTKTQRQNKKLWHALSGAAYLETVLGITDGEVISAVACHTSGKGDMTLLEKIIYIADYIEPGREELPNVAEVRKLAFHDIDACLYRILKASLVYLDSRNIPIDPMTEKSYQYYKEKLDQKEE